MSILSKLLLILVQIFLISCNTTKNQENHLTVKEKIIKIGVIDYVNSVYTEDAEKGIIDGLQAALGNGKDTYTIDVKNAQGDISALNMIGDFFSQNNFDLIFAITPPAIQVAMRKIKNTPIVFTNAGNPIEAGVGKSFTDHLPNITGISTITDFEAAVKVIRNFYPNVKTIGSLFNPSEIDSVLYTEKFKEILKKNSIELITVAVQTPAEISEATMALCNKKIDVICQIIDNVTGSSFVQIAKVTKKNKMPLFCFGIIAVKNGMALAAASRDYYDCGIESANIGVKILNGTKPSQIPIVIAQKTRLALNKDLAEYYGIKLTTDNTKIFDKIY